MNKQVKCIDSEGFNFISTGTVYTIEKETRDFVYIINDNGLRKRYGKNRFEAIKPEKKAEAPVAPKKPEKKFAECIFPKYGALSFKKKYEYEEAPDTNKIIVKDDTGETAEYIKKRFQF